MSKLTVKFWGTRGSIPVAGESYARYGGNTTCVEVISDRLPAGYKLVIDAGTGIIPLGQEILRTGQAVSTIGVLFTHFHHDHTQGLLMLPQLYNKTVEIQLLGPQENGTGPKEVMETLMRPPFFPVSFAEVCSHVKCKGIEHPASKVIAIHPQARPTLITLEELERVEKDLSQQLRLGSGRRVELAECLIIKMYRSNHPERTISYRVEERSTGKVFVFLTDHENTDGIPTALKRHLSGVHLLAMDGQYTREQYTQYTAGFGHGTPDYCLKVANEVSAEKLLLTHHDPGRSDDGIREMQNGFGLEFRTKGDDYVHIVADGETFQV